MKKLTRVRSWTSWSTRGAVVVIAAVTTCLWLSVWVVLCASVRVSGDATTHGNPGSVGDASPQRTGAAVVAAAAVAAGASSMGSHEHARATAEPTQPPHLRDSTPPSITNTATNTVAAPSVSAGGGGGGGDRTANTLVVDVVIPPTNEVVLTSTLPPDHDRVFDTMKASTEPSSQSSASPTDKPADVAVANNTIPVVMSDFLDSLRLPVPLDGPDVVLANVSRIAHVTQHGELLYLLGDMHLYGKYNRPQNVTRAFETFRLMADVHGNSTAHYLLGFLYSNGVGTPVHRVKGLLHDVFGASGGDMFALMTMAYRNLIGIDVEKNCDEAVKYYRLVADQVIDKARGRFNANKFNEHVSLAEAELERGLWGVSSEDDASNTDILEYYASIADRGNTTYQLYLGQIYYLATYTKEPDYENAYYYFTRAFEESARNPFDPAEQVINGMAAGWLGEMYYYGVVPQALYRDVSKVTAPASSIPKASFWQILKQRIMSLIGHVIPKVMTNNKGPLVPKLVREALQEEPKNGKRQDFNFKMAYRFWLHGATKESAVSLNGLGMLSREGIIMPKDSGKAMEFFRVSAETGNADAVYNLGLAFVEEKDYNKAYAFFQAASHQAHLGAMYYRAFMYLHGLGVVKSCATAASLYKIIAERSDWLTVHLDGAYDDFMKRSNKRVAILKYWMAADAGVEVAQMNVAHLLGKGLWSFPKKESPVSQKSYERALTQYERASIRGNTHARLTAGDYHYYGKGTNVSYAIAAEYYQSAADNAASGQAYFNLGYMHETGKGLALDFPLAKRYYDKCADSSPESWIPAKLALVKLETKQFWQRLVSRVGIDLFSSGTSHLLASGRNRASSGDVVSKVPAVPSGDTLSPSSQSLSSSSSSSPGGHVANTAPGPPLVDIEGAADSSAALRPPSQTQTSPTPPSASFFSADSDTLTLLVALIAFVVIGRLRQQQQRPQQQQNRPEQPQQRAEDPIGDFLVHPPWRNVPRQPPPAQQDQPPNADTVSNSRHHRTTSSTSFTSSSVPTTAPSTSSLRATPFSSSSAATGTAALSSTNSSSSSSSSSNGSVHSSGTTGSTTFKASHTMTGTHLTHRAAAASYNDDDGDEE